MFDRACQHVGAAISSLARILYWKGLGLRIPAARILVSDLRKERDHCERMVAESQSNLASWRARLDAVEDALEEAEWEQNRLLNTLDIHFKRRST